MNEIEKIKKEKTRLELHIENLVEWFLRTHPEIEYEGIDSVVNYAETGSGDKKVTSLKINVHISI
jgi:hypothetical protein